MPRDAALPKWDLDAAIAHLQTQSHKDSTGDCSIYVRQAIEAGGIRMNKSLNSGGGGAYGFGPILWDAGFRTVSSGEEPQKGDVAIFQPVKGHPNGISQCLMETYGYRILGRKMYMAAPAIVRARSLTFFTDGRKRAM